MKCFENRLIVKIYHKKVNMENREKYKVKDLSTKEIVLINGGSQKAREAGRYWGWKFGCLYAAVVPAIALALITKKINI